MSANAISLPVSPRCGGARSGRTERPGTPRGIIASGLCRRRETYPSECEETAKNGADAGRYMAETAQDADAGPPRPSLADEPEADPRLRQDVAWHPARGLDLLTQRRHGDTQGVRGGLVVRTPHLRQQHPRRDDPVRVAREQRQDVELGTGQVDR